MALGLGGDTYLSMGCAVGLRLGEATGGGGSQVLGPAQQEISGWWVAGTLGAGLLCTQQLWGPWNSRETGLVVVSGRYTGRIVESELLQL